MLRCLCCTALDINLVQFFPGRKNIPKMSEATSQLGMSDEKVEEMRTLKLLTVPFSQLVETLVLNNRKGVLYYNMIHVFGPNAATQVMKASLTGSRLLEMLIADSEIAGKMMEPPLATAESAFQEPKDLTRFGYTVHENFSEPEYAYTITGFQSVLSTMGLTTGFTSYNQSDTANLPDVPFGPNRCIGHGNKTPGREFRGKTGPEMKSHFHQIVNVQDGLLMAIDNCSPVAAY